VAADSSTAQLKIAEHFIPSLTVTPLFNVALHVGTLVVVVFYFRREVKNILSALVPLDCTSKTVSRESNKRKEQS
jgi:undecaprenyl pyrophosphate phosphatase UppP